MCGSILHSQGSLKEILFSEDIICEKCRSSWKRINRKGFIDGVPIYSTWDYNSGFKDALIQYKECGDEALSDVFLNLVKKELELRYHGYTMVFMPSSKEKEDIRGFKHLELMFSKVNLKKKDVFIKTGNIDQKGKNHQEREMIREYIKKIDGVVLPRKILLVDDVLTSGSTIRAALRLLDKNKHEIKIYTCSIAGLDS